MNNLDGFRVAVIATDGFEQSELIEPVKALKEAGATVKIVAPKPGKIQGFKHFDKGDTVDVDLVLGDVDAEQFDGAVLPGGALNADVLRMDENLRKFLTDFQTDGKPMAAICHAPWELASAGLLRNRRLTSYYTIQDDLRNAGAEWVDEEVVVDDNLVTSRKPDDLPAFNKAMIALFGRFHSELPDRQASSEAGEEMGAPI